MADESANPNLGSVEGVVTVIVLTHGVAISSSYDDGAHEGPTNETTHALYRALVVSSRARGWGVLVVNASPVHPAPNHAEEN